MDSGTIIIGAASLIICILPFVFLNQNRKKAEKKRLQFLSDLAARHHCTITRHEFLGPLAIGLDEANKYVFFIRKLHNEDIAQAVNLASMRGCQIVKNSRTIHNKEGAYLVIDQLGLRFSPSDKNTPETTLEFYNAEVSMQMVGELQMAERWEKIIHERIPNATQG